VVITLDLDDDLIIGTVKWQVVAAGTICNVGHSTGSHTVYGDTTVTLFDQRIRLNCGTECAIDTSYAINLFEPTLTGYHDWGTKTITVSGTLRCDPCNDALVQGQ